MSEFRIHITITVPGKPAGKARPRFTRKPIKTRKGLQFTYPDKKTASEERAIGFMARAEMRGNPPHDGPMKMRVTAYFPIPASWSLRRKEDASSGFVLPTGKPDHDNMMKLCCDALNKIVYCDDAQIVDAHTIKLYTALEPKTVIEVWGL